MKLFTGNVTSTSMAKTAAVEVTRQWMHPLYKKTVKRTKKFLVHDDKQTAAVGDVITFTPCRPISKRKHFMLVNIIHKAPVLEVIKAKAPSIATEPKKNVIKSKTKTKKTTAKPVTKSKTTKKKAVKK